MKNNKLKYILISLGVIVVGAVFVKEYLSRHPWIVIGKIQDVMYQDKTINSFEPFRTPTKEIKENGILYMNDILYAKEYPNSFLDISYPSNNTSIDRPTIIYFHGGGFFGGDKAVGDPMAINDNANALFDELVKKDYNLVNVNYALVPDYYFSVPLIQMNQAIDFLVENAKKYQINMNNVVIMGGSAGAVLTSQYGALLANEGYRKQLNLYPSLTLDDVKALVIDDAPLITDKFGYDIGIIIKNYINKIDLINSEEAKLYNSYLYINNKYPATFLTAGNKGSFPEDMKVFSEKLTEYNIDNIYFYRDKKYGEIGHGYLSDIRTNKYAKDCFTQLIDFIGKYTD